MTGPRTLFDMAGVEFESPRLSQTALVVIDAQRVYLDGGVPLEGIDVALDRLTHLLERARSVGTPIIHIVHHGAAGGPYDPDGQGAQIIDQVAPQGGEPVVAKLQPNAFAGTDLDSRLRELDRPTLTLAGFMTHMCVSTSARAASEYGFRTYVAGDCTATRALPDPLGGVVPAAQVHHAALAALADLVAKVLPVGKILD